MFPDFEYLLEAIFGTDIPGWVGIFKTFGFFVAMAFLAAAYVLVKDMKRKEALGLMHPTFHTEIFGKPVTASELAISGLIGFILGYKVGGFFGHWQEIAPNPLGYVLSLDGNFLGGLIGAALFVWSKWAEKKKAQLPEPVERQVATYPHQRIGELTILAAVAGLSGAKIFNAFETWDDFLRNPIENLLSSSGLTFYGGLILASIVIALYARRHKISIAQLADSFAPAMMLAYGVGRLGCQFAGDGDWGIFNSAYITDASGHLVRAATDNFTGALHTDTGYLASLLRQFGTMDNIPHAYTPAPGWLPDWLFAQNYPHNVNNEGVPLLNCVGNYCAVLPVSVYPTPLYEAVVCIGLFFVLWSLRKRFTTPLHLSGIYLIINGIERFLVETIRVNFRYDWGVLHPSQAEIIAVGMILFGIVLLTIVKKKKVATT